MEKEKLLLEVEDVKFTEEDHTYVGTVSGKEYISATTLLKKYGLTPSEYAHIPKEILEKKAAYGTEVHKALEEYIKGDETQLIIPEVKAFADWLDSQSLSTLDCTPEEKVFNEYYGVAGTIDLQVWNIMADFKTTATLHIVPVMWQLSLYNFLKNPDEEKYSMTELKVFWFSSKGDLSVRDIPLVPYNRIISLLNAYNRGEETWVDDSIPSDLVEKVDLIVKHRRLVNSVKKNLNALKNEEDVLRAAIEEQMAEESRIYVDTPSGIVTVTEVSTNRYDSTKVTNLLLDKHLNPDDYKKTTTYTKFNIKDKGKE